MRISDWSSDVCSSDLAVGRGEGREVATRPRREAAVPLGRRQVERFRRQRLVDPAAAVAAALDLAARLMEIRDGLQSRVTRLEGLVVEREDGLRQVDEDRKSVVKGQSVSVRVRTGGRRILRKKTEKAKNIK